MEYQNLVKNNKPQIHSPNNNNDYKFLNLFILYYTKGIKNQDHISNKKFRLICSLKNKTNRYLSADFIIVFTKVPAGNC